MMDTASIFGSTAAGKTTMNEHMRARYWWYRANRKDEVYLQNAAWRIASECMSDAEVRSEVDKVRDKFALAVYLELPVDVSIDRNIARAQETGRKVVYARRDMTDGGELTRGESWGVRQWTIAVNAACRRLRDALRRAGVPVLEFSGETATADIAAAIERHVRKQGYGRAATITRAQFSSIAARGMESGGDAGEHWATASERWKYHAAAAEIAAMLPLRCPCAVVEVGTMGASVVTGSDTMDYAERWNMPGFAPTITHDIRRCPWPVADKQYDLLIALRVWHHLGDLARGAFLEAKRVADRVLLCSSRSNEPSVEQVAEWAGAPPLVTADTKRGVVSVWR
jgi:hypothetical protein